MITTPKFKGNICEQTRNKVVKKIAENTKKIFSQHFHNIRTKLLSNNSQIQGQINSFIKKFSQQHYAIIARQSAKQQEQKIWKDSEDYKFFTHLQRLFTQNQEYKLSPQQQIVQTHKEVSKCIEKEAQKIEVFQIPPFQKETMIKQADKKDESKFRTQSKVLQDSKISNDQQKKAQKANPFLSAFAKSQLSNPANTNNPFMFPKASQCLFGNKIPNLLPNQNSDKDEKEAKSNIFTVRSNPLNSQIFGSHISSRQISSSSSGIMDMQGIFCDTKSLNDVGQAISSLQLTSEPSKNSPFLFNQK